MCVLHTMVCVTHSLLYSRVCEVHPLQGVVYTARCVYTPSSTTPIRTTYVAINLFFLVLPFSFAEGFPAFLRQTHLALRVCHAWCYAPCLWIVWKKIPPMRLIFFHLSYTHTCMCVCHTPACVLFCLSAANPLTPVIFYLSFLVIFFSLFSTFLNVFLAT